MWLTDPPNPAFQQSETCAASVRSRGTSSASGSSGERCPKPDVPIVCQQGKYRLQLSNLRMTDAALVDFLNKAKTRLVELYAKQLVAQDPEFPVLQSSTPVSGDTTLFSEVPLIEVTLNRNYLTDASMPLVLDFLLANQHIESFEILGNQLTDDSAPMIQRLLSESRLQRIKIGDNRFTHVGAATISESLKHAHNGFLQLHVGGNPLGDEGVEIICNACVASHVEVVGLRDVGVTGKGWDALGRICFGSLVSELQLKGNALDAAGGALLVNSARTAAVGEHAEKRVSVLSNLSLASCSIQPETWQSVVEFVAMHSRLATLDISNNPLGDACVEALQKWLDSPSGHRLRHLNLQRTQLTAAGLAQLAGYSADCTAPKHRSRHCSLSHLQELDLSFNGLGLDATPILTRIVECCPQLQRLALHHCLVGGPQLPALCKAIASHPALSDIDFSSNFSMEFGSAWEIALNRNLRLERLLLTDNQMPSKVTGSIIHCIVHGGKQNLKNVQIGGQSKVSPTANSVLPDAHCSLAQALARNKSGIPVKRDSATSAAPMQSGSIPDATPAFKEPANLAGMPPPAKPRKTDRGAFWQSPGYQPPAVHQCMGSQPPLQQQYTAGYFVQPSTFGPLHHTQAAEGGPWYGGQPQLFPQQLFQHPIAPQSAALFSVPEMFPGQQHIGAHNGGAVMWLPIIQPAGPMNFEVFT